MAQGTTKGVPIDTDSTLSLNSDLVVPSQKAIVSYLSTKVNGTTNYISKFTASGTIGNSLIQEGALGNISVNTTPDSGVQFLVNSTNCPDAGRFTNSNTGTPTAGIRSIVNGANAFNNVGGIFTAVNGANNYAIQLFDGTQAVGKYLKCVGTNGEANWSTLITPTDYGIVYAVSTGNILL